MRWLIPLLLLIGCKKQEIEYARFNHPTDVFVVEVGPDVPLDEQVITLHSSTGAAEIGTAELSPGGGPVGTEVDLVVRLNFLYAEEIARADIVTYSEDRGEETFELQQDSAQESLWVQELIIMGVNGEVRQDEIEIRLWKYALPGEGDETEE